MKAMIHDSVDASTPVLGMLNDLGGLDVREFMAPEDDRYATDRMLTEQLEVVIHAVIKILSKGVSPVTGQVRIAIFRQALQSGLRMLRQYSIECRSQMRTPDKWLSQYIQAGGLRNAQHQRTKSVRLG